MLDNEILLSADKTVSRQDNVVLRPSGPWTPHVHDFLRQLESAGFPAQRVNGSGFASDGRETLSFIEGEFVHPGPWSDEAMVEVGRMLRRLHDAGSSFEPAEDAVWKPWFLRELGGPGRVISHGDVAPWNMVTRDGMPVAL
ncbi:aminoglycoside phosphotransferase/kinase family protein [Paenibacillus alkalitolerans]|uniref:hypothetical protein n=1 Tax=Paenibacillus alkalitolerans TaxID=2799335 RepID=UPI001F2A5D87|nr:hypothetical protein [Paenibacillus alkalitolerans]